MNIAPPGNPFPTGSVIHLEAGAEGKPPKFGTSKKVEGVGESAEWRTYDITAIGGRITAKIDGAVVAELEDPEPIAEGYIGLQHNTGKVQFRNVKSATFEVGAQLICSRERRPPLGVVALARSHLEPLTFDFDRDLAELAASRSGLGGGLIGEQVARAQLVEDAGIDLRQ